MHKLPHLYKSRHGVWYIRYQEDGREVKRSLKTKDWHVARLLGLRFNLSLAMTFRKFDIVFPNGIRVENINSDEDVDRVIKWTRAEGIEGLCERPAYLRDKETRQEQPRKATRSPQEPRTQQESLGALRSPQEPLGSPRSPQEPRTQQEPLEALRSPQKRTKKLSEVVSHYLAEKRLENTEKTIKEKETNYEEFIRFFGDLDINLYTSEHSLSLKSRWIGEKQSALRINKRLSFLKDLFAYAIDHRLYFDVNPFQNVLISKKSKLRAKVASYEQFTDDELKLIFSETAYREYMNKPDYFWLPFLALHSGARIEELASLQTRQIKKESEIWFIDLEKGKNANSIRRIPLHRNIENSGFLAYVDSVRSNPTGQLFPKLTAGMNGFSKNCSRRFGLYLDKIGIKDGRKVFHSFRSTFINRMSETNVHAALLMGIVGHYDQAKVDFSSTHFQTYQQKKPLKILKEAIDKLEYDLNLFF
ncbi:MAG: site-specific integrase [Leptothrix sp. (in: b-proteobacteria)]